MSLLSNSRSVWDSLVLTNVAPAYFITASTSTHKGWMTLAAGYSSRLQALTIWQMTLFILLDFIPFLFSSSRDIKIPLCFRNAHTRQRSNQAAAKWEGSKPPELYFPEAFQWQTPTQSQKKGGQVDWNQTLPQDCREKKMSLTHFENRSWRTLTPHFKIFIFGTLLRSDCGISVLRYDCTVKKKWEQLPFKLCTTYRISSEATPAVK